MARPVRQMAWNHCPICGQALVQADDGQSERPYCGDCNRFYYSNPVPAACCFIRDNENKLLFVQRSVEPRKGYWTLPGGFVELGETTEEAALRELEEETALRGSGTKLVGVTTKGHKHSGGIIVMGYVVDEWEGDPKPDTDAMDLGFFAPHERPPMAFDAHEELLCIFDEMFDRRI